jgi:hypothetical protein
MSRPPAINAELRYAENLGVTVKCEFGLGVIVSCAQYSVCCRSAGYKAGKHTLAQAMTVWVLRSAP